MSTSTAPAPESPPTGCSCTKQGCNGPQAWHNGLLKASSDHIKTLFDQARSEQQQGSPGTIAQDEFEAAVTNFMLHRRHASPEVAANFPVPPYARLYPK